MGMQMNLLKPGAIVKSRHRLSPERAKHWKYANINSDIGGGIAQGAMLKVVEVSISPPRTKLELPGRLPPAYIFLSGEEIANLFDMDPEAQRSLSPEENSHNLMKLFQKLSQKQAATHEGLTVLREARSALSQSIDSALFWGNIAVISNAIILPLNIIINAFDAKAAMSAYQLVVKELYSQFSKSGTRIQPGPIKNSLSIIKKSLVEALKAKGLTDYVPGVNLLVGLAEDGVTLFQTASMVSDGSIEMRQLMLQMEKKIATAEHEYTKIGIKIDQLISEIQLRQRTS